MAKAVKLSISISPELAAAIRKVVPAGQVSSFMEDAVTEHVRNARLRRILEEDRAELGVEADAERVRQFADLMKALESLPDVPD